MILRPSRGAAARKEITALAAVLAVCCDHRSLREILEAAGWFSNSRTQRALGEKVLECLDDAAEALGLGRAVGNPH